MRKVHAGSHGANRYKILVLARLEVCNQALACVLCRVDVAANHAAKARRQAFHDLLCVLDGRGKQHNAVSA